MHQRDKHFKRGGTELDAPPKYMYEEHLNFMREFSIKKEIAVEERENSEAPEAPNLAPEQLLHEEVSYMSGMKGVAYMDYTNQFIELVKDFPELYDEYAEMRKYRAKDVWKKISESLGKFTIGQLRQYWIRMMKKYKLYLDNFVRYHGSIENEEIFDQLQFASAGFRNKRDHADDDSVQFEILNSKDLNDDAYDEEHLVCEELEIDDGDDYTADEISEIEEPELKKQKIQIVSYASIANTRPSMILNVVQPTKSEKSETSYSTEQQAEEQILQPAKEDEFDFFGKKVALQLRQIAQRNRLAARKGEIKVLQLLMELEESLDS